MRLSHVCGLTPTTQFERQSRDASFQAKAWIQALAIYFQAICFSFLCTNWASLDSFQTHSCFLTGNPGRACVTLHTLLQTKCVHFCKLNARISNSQVLALHVWMTGTAARVRLLPSCSLFSCVSKLQVVHEWTTCTYFGAYCVVYFIFNTPVYMSYV